jgi:hypothetical protein
MAQLLGFPGKLGRHGSEVWDQYLSGKIGEIRDYCETDALNTYLIYLRFELMRGNLDAASHERELALVRETLRSSGRAHLQAYLRAWTGAPAA